MSCCQCLEIYSSQTEYKKRHGHYHHVIIQKSESIYWCNVCSKVYPTLNAANRHKRLVHDKKHQCRHCHERFASKWHYDRHQRKHKQSQIEVLHEGGRGGGSYKCGVCDKVLSDRTSLETHIKLQHESRAKEYVCRHCKKRFAKRTALEIHTASHLKRDERLCGFKCPLCDNMFTLESNLKRHLKKQHQ